MHNTTSQHLSSALNLRVSKFSLFAIHNIMASKQIMLQDSTQQAIEGELSVSIVDQIRETHDHAHADDNFDVESLLVVVRNILNGDTLVEDDSLVIIIIIYFSAYRQTLW